MNWFKDKRLFTIMNTCAALSKIEPEVLQEYLANSKTWVEFKTKCGLPKSRRQDGIRKYLDDNGLDYTHLPLKGQSGMRQKSAVWAVPEDTFQEYVAASHSWSELLERLGYDTTGNVGTVRRRIKELGIDYSHLRHKIDVSHLNAEFLKEQLEASQTWRDLVERCKVKRHILKRLLIANKLDYSHLPKPRIVDDPNVAFTSGTRVAKPILKKFLLDERGHTCENCGLTEWNDKPIPLKVFRLNHDPTNNTRENLVLYCPNCISITKFANRTKHSQV